MAVIVKKFRHAPVETKAQGCHCARRASHMLSYEISSFDQCIPDFFCNRLSLTEEIEVGSWEGFWAAGMTDGACLTFLQQVELDRGK